MSQAEQPSIQQLEEQLARISERLAQREHGGGGWLGLLGGLGLGALTGGVLAYVLRSREEEPASPTMPSASAPRRADDAVVLHGTPAPASTPTAQDDDAPILLKTMTGAVAPPAQATATDGSVGKGEPQPAVAAAPTVENEAIPAPAVAPPRSAVTPAPAEPTVENEALPAAAIAQAPAEPTGVASEATDAPAVAADEDASGSVTAEGYYPGSVAPIGEQCPPGFEIKGNRSRNGDLLYHTPASNNFARTKPEACFATEEDAEAAGFRKARS